MHLSYLKQIGFHADGFRQGTGDFAISLQENRGRNLHPLLYTHGIHGDSVHIVEDWHEELGGDEHTDNCSSRNKDVLEAVHEIFSWDAQKGDGGEKRCHHGHRYGKHLQNERDSEFVN